jgi:hypothetical protein
MTIKYFTIYGERCSGTNFLMIALLKNFELEYTSEYSWKHFFGFYDFDSFKDNPKNDETLFISIIREPISWIDSFYRKKHHVPPHNRKSINTFLFNEFYSIYNDDMNIEIMEDRHITTKDRYKNIFELRKVKNNFLINEMPKKVKNYLLIRYEDIRDNYDIILDYFHIKFNLVKKNDKYIKINNYKGIKNYVFNVKEISLNRNIIKIIKKNLDIEQEKSIGYIL